jgi:CO/xanthine dehydrogenase Mo-binding subunit
VRFLTGQGRFIDDINLPGQLYLFVVRSLHAHAKILDIKVSTLQKSFPDVFVLTSADVAPEARIPVRISGGEGISSFLQPPLARDRVRYVGEPLAVVVAGSRQEAEDAAEALEVVYEPLEPVLDCVSALEDRAQKIYEAGNCVARFSMEKGQVDSVFADAPVVLEHQFSIQRHTAVPMEPRGLLADFNKGTGRLSVWGPTKLPYVNRSILSALLHMSEQDITFIEPDVGGSFGVRGEFYPEDMLVPLASMRIGRPIKWVESRRDHFCSINHSREQSWILRVAADREGKLIAIDAELYHDMGAYVRTHGTIVAHHAGTSLPGPYFLEHYRCRVVCSVTNKTPTGTMRAPGMFESSFVRERAIDLLAQKLSLNPLEVRQKNLIGPHQMPYLIYPNWHGPYKPQYDSGNFAEVLRKTLHHLNENGSGFRPEAVGSLRIASGLALTVEPSGLGPFERATLRATVEGRFILFVGSTSQGQSQETTFAQICSELLQLPSSFVSVRHGNTDEMAVGYGTNASRAAVMGGKAVYLACQKLLQRGKEIAALRLGVPLDEIRYEQGAFWPIHPGKGSALGWAELARSVSPLAIHGGSSIPGFEYTHALEVTSHATNVQEGTAVFSVHWARVSVDIDTGEIKVLRYLVACDAGRVLNPAIVEGQLQGGVVMGLGGALAEALVYDSDGQLLTATLLDYALLTAADVPNIETLVFEDVPSPSNPLGVRGVGEVGTSGAGAVIANAVSNALNGTGLEITSLPLTSNNVFSLLHSK